MASDVGPIIYKGSFVMRVKPNSLLAVLVGFTLNLGLSGVVEAALPDAFGGVQIQDTDLGLNSGPFGSDLIMNTTWSWSTPTHGVSATATSEPLPSLTVTASSGLPSPISWQGSIINATGTLRYFYSIDGPADINVPFKVSGIYSMEGYGYLIASVNVLSSYYTGLYNFTNQCGITCNENGTFAGTSSLLSNTVGAIDLRIDMALASVWNYDSNSGTSSNGSAYIDPYIEIDPTWALANPGYSISVSPGVGNVASVPEAETYAMMLAGLGLVGFVARRRKQLEA